jgi:hypothetical protein
MATSIIKHPAHVTHFNGNLLPHINGRRKTTSMKKKTPLFALCVSARAFRICGTWVKCGELNEISGETVELSSDQKV